MPDGGFALSGLRGVVGRVSAAPPGKQCLMAAPPYQAYVMCRPGKRSATRQAMPDGGFALSGLRDVVGRVRAAPPGKMPDGDFVLSGLRDVVGRVSAAPPGKQCLMATSSYQAYAVL